MESREVIQSERERRYNVRMPAAVEVVVERKGGLLPEQVPARLLDLTPKGAKLSLDSPLQFMEPVAVRLVSAHAGVEQRHFAQVRWVRAGEGDEWLAGCSWDAPVPQEVLDQLASTGALQRRESARMEVDGEATVWWGPGKGVKVRFLDLSEGGFCLGSPEPGQGAWLRVVPAAVGEQHVQIIAQLRWQRQIPDGYQLGCKFADPKDYAVLQRLLCHPEAGYRPELKELRSAK